MQDGQIYSHIHVDLSGWSTSEPRNLKRDKVSLLDLLKEIEAAKIGNKYKFSIFDYDIITQRSNPVLVFRKRSGMPRMVIKEMAKKVARHYIWQNIDKKTWTMPAPCLLRDNKVNDQLLSSSVQYNCSNRHLVLFSVLGVLMFSENLSDCFLFGCFAQTLI